jgi:hypothetical protein
MTGHESSGEGLDEQMMRESLNDINPRGELTRGRVYARVHEQGWHDSGSSEQAAHDEEGDQDTRRG